MPTVAIDTSDASGPQPRGWGRYVRELSRALPDADSLEYHFLDGSAARGPELVWEQLTLPRLLRREGADLVHSPNVFLPLRRPCPGVVTMHDLAFEEYPQDFSRRTGWKYRTLAPRAVRSAERVICVSEWTRADVERRYGADPEKLRVVHSAPALPEGQEQPPEGPYLLAVGDLREKKNFARLAAAFRSLHDEGLPHRLLIAGTDSGEGGRIGAAAGHAPVELLGYVSDQRLDALMRGADLLVHPSLYEGFGLVLLEAMARGCPVAAAEATALPETCAGAALLFDPLDQAAIAGAMRAALGDEALRRDLAQRGRARAAEFSWEKTAAGTAAVYREALVRTSIVLLSFDEAHLLRHSLPAAASQRADELIVADNATTDATPEVAREHGARLVQFEHRQTYAQAANAALACATGDAVLLLNADCFLEPGFLASARARLEEPGVGSVAPKLIRTLGPEPATRLDAIDAAGMVVDRRRKNTLVAHGRPSLAYDSPGEAFGVDGAAALYRRETLEDCKLEGEVFDTDMERWASDVDLAWRARLLGWRCAYEPQAVAYHVRWYSPSTRARMPTSDRRMQFRNRYLMMVKNDTREGLLRDLPRIAAYEALALGYALTREQGLLRGYGDAARLLPGALRRRRELQARARSRGTSTVRFGLEPQP